MDWYNVRVYSENEALCHSSQIRAYFYGTPLYLPPSVNPATAQLGGEAATETTLSPFSITLDFKDIQIYRIGDSGYTPQLK